MTADEAYLKLSDLVPDRTLITVNFCHSQFTGNKYANVEHRIIITADTWQRVYEGGSIEDATRIAADDLPRICVGVR